ncbi:MAG: hypothetical protein [Circular genetic element sp.]|nr:MAG: hypothetical protein [Circular genetic element sp.]
MSQGSYSVVMHGDVDNLSNGLFALVAWDSRPQTLTSPAQFVTDGPTSKRLSIPSYTGRFSINMTTDNGTNDGLSVTTCQTGAPTSATNRNLAQYNPQLDKYSMRPFISTYLIDYPVGYEGQIIPDTWTPPNYEIPVFDWTVKQTGSLSIRYSQNLDPPPDGKFTLGIWKCADDWKDGDPCDVQTIYQNMDSAPAATAKWEGSLPPPMAGEYELPSSGNYVAIISHKCIDGKPCVNKAESITFNMDWDGKSFLSGQTSSTENHTKNLQNPVWVALNNVSTPTYGIQAIIQAPITFAYSLVQQVGNCSPITFPAVRTLEFTFPCVGQTIKNNFGTVVTIYQTILTALVFYWISVSSLRFVKNAQKPDGDDSIKVMQL